MNLESAFDTDIAKAAQWSAKPLGAVVDILDSKRKPITKRDRVAGPYPYYGATGVLDWVQGYIFDEPLVLIGEDGAKWGAGDASAFPVSGKIWVNNHAHVLRPDRERLLDDWLIYYLNAVDLGEFISGMTVPKLNQGRLREISIPLPPLEEQKRIVAVLDKAFAALDRARALVEANLADAEELFSRALASEMEQLTAIYPAQKMRELVTFHNGDRGKNYPNKSEYVEDGISWLNTGQIQPDGGLSELKMNYISEGKFNQLGGGKTQVGDLVFCLRGATIGKTAFVGRHVPGAVASSLMIIRPKEGLGDRFIYYFLISDLGEKEIARFIGGAAQPNLAGKSVADFNVPFPSLAEQNKIADRLDLIRRQVANCQKYYGKKINDLADLRQSILQKAFAGELT